MDNEIEELLEHLEKCIKVPYGNIECYIIMDVTFEQIKNVLAKKNDKLSLRLKEVIEKIIGEL